MQNKRRQRIQREKIHNWMTVPHNSSYPPAWNYIAPVSDGGWNSDAAWSHAWMEADFEFVVEGRGSLARNLVWWWKSSLAPGVRQFQVSCWRKTSGYQKWRIRQIRVFCGRWALPSMKVKRFSRALIALSTLPIATPLRSLSGGVRSGMEDGGAAKRRRYHAWNRRTLSNHHPSALLLTIFSVL